MQRFSRPNALISALRLLMISCAILAAAGTAQPARAGGGRCYVDASAGGANTGLTWADAYTNLHFALTQTCSDFWVANGVYKPGASQTDTFSIEPGDKVYGGFAGGETLLEQRNVLLNVTILSGDIGGDDDSSNADGNFIDELASDIVGNNNYNVVTMNGTLGTPVTASTVLDSFFITGGDGGASHNGGGLYCVGTGAAHECSPTLGSLLFMGNRAQFGGAIYNLGSTGGISSPTISLSVFSGNSANSYGGAVYNAGSGGTSSPLFLAVVFDHNNATTSGGAVYNDGEGGGVSSPAFGVASFSNNTAGSYGGAVTNDGSGGTSSPVFAVVSFNDNTASSLGGAVYNEGGNSGQANGSFANVTFYHNGALAGPNGGAVTNSGSVGGTSSPSFRNVTFSSNMGGLGAAMYSNGTGGTSAPSLFNVIEWGNTSGAGTDIFNATAAPSISHSVIEASGGSGGSWDSTLGTDGGGNLDADPLLGPFQNNSGLTSTMALMAGSSAINTGDDATCAAYPVLGGDQRGISRPRGPHCDIGAYERIPPPIDFEGDGKSDLGYFHAATGVWGVLDSNSGFSYGSPQFFSWGQTGDIIVPGDYDGDGLADPTIRRPPASGQSAAYMVLKSSTGYNFGSPLIIPAGWPGLGDTPVPADYNGDGKTDPAIFRSTTGVWIIPLSPAYNTQQFASWGTSGDKPVGADVDGDGKADIGYFRPSTGTWGFLLSSQAYSYAFPRFFSWGGSTDTPVMADYDGDSKADPAFVTPPASGQSAAYRVLLSSTNYNYGLTMTIPAGWPGLGDTPVPQDYDGDNKIDAGIWRGNTGVWIIPLSSTNYVSYLYSAWGTSTDQVVK